MASLFQVPPAGQVCAPPPHVAMHAKHLDEHLCYRLARRSLDTPRPGPTSTTTFVDRQVPLHVDTPSSSSTRVPLPSPKTCVTEPSSPTMTCTTTFDVDFFKYPFGYAKVDYARRCDKYLYRRPRTSTKTCTTTFVCTTSSTMTRERLLPSTILNHPEMHASKV